MPVIRERRFLRVKLDMVGRWPAPLRHVSHRAPDFQENPWTMGKDMLEKVAARSSRARTTSC
jgi:hypothetical protein